MNQDFNYILRQKFDGIVKEAEVLAKDAVKQMIDELQLEDLSAIDQLIKIERLDEELDQIFERHEFAGYSRYHTMDGDAFKIFSTRFLFYQVDESDALKDTIILDAKRKAIIDLQTNKYHCVPEFTFASLQNTKNAAYARFYAMSAHCSKEDYYKIRGWQSDMLMQIVELEYISLQRMIRNHCKQKPDVMHTLRDLKGNLDNLYDTDNTTSTDEVIARAKKLIFFQHANYSFGDTNEWVIGLRLYQDRKLIRENIIPIIIRGFLKEFKKKPPFPITNYPFLWLAMDRVEMWINRILDGSLEINEDVQANFSKLFSSAYEEGIGKSRELIEQFSTNNNRDVQSTEQFRESLYDRLDELRRKSNTDQFLHYYRYIDDEKQIKKIFQFQCFFSDNPEKEKDDLAEVVWLSEEISWITGQIFDIDEKIPFNRKAKKNDNERWENDFFETMKMMRIIAFDHDLYKKMSDRMTIDMLDFHNGYKPMYFCMMDTEDKAREIFQEAMTRLQHVLDRQPQTSKVLYIQDRLKDLRHRELEGKQHGWESSKLESHVKEFLLIESDFIEETRHITFSALQLPLTSPHLALPETLSFGYKLDTTETLYKIYHALNNKISFINDSKTSVDDFINILVSRDLQTIKSHIHLSCETTQFAYIVDKLQQYFRNFTPTNIEKSGRFFSKKGTVITRTNLYANKIDSPKNVQEIDKCFE